MKKLKDEETVVRWWASHTATGGTKYQKKSLRKGSVLTSEVGTEIVACRNGFHFCKNVENVMQFIGDPKYLWMVRVPEKNGFGHDVLHDTHFKVELNFDPKGVASYRHHVDYEPIVTKVQTKEPIYFIEKNLAKLKTKAGHVAPIIFKILENAKNRGRLLKTEGDKICFIQPSVLNWGDIDQMMNGQFERFQRREALLKAKKILLARNKA